MFPFFLSNVVNESDLSELIGPIIGGSVASAVLLIIIIFLLIALLCLIKQRSRIKQSTSSFSESLYSLAFIYRIVGLFREGKLVLMENLPFVQF